MAANQVTVATPGPAGATGIVYEGLWVTATVYQVRDLVRYLDGNLYVCNVQHTAAYDFSQAFYDLELSQSATNAKVLRGKVNLVRELN